MQSWAMNMRRAACSRIRGCARRSNFAFDFEWSNANLFYGQYTRSRSYFNNSELEAKGLPSPEELAILEPLKAQASARSLHHRICQPGQQDAAGPPQEPARGLAGFCRRRAGRSAQDGGRTVLKNAKGESLHVRIPSRLAALRAHRAALQAAARTARHRRPDQHLSIAPSISAASKTFDYDIIVGSWGQSLSPGNEQREFWGSDAADRKGSRNLVGIKNPAIDSCRQAHFRTRPRRADRSLRRSTGC